MELHSVIPQAVQLLLSYKLSCGKIFYHLGRKLRQQNHRLYIKLDLKGLEMFESAPFLSVLVSILLLKCN